MKYVLPFKINDRILNNIYTIRKEWSIINYYGKYFTDMLRAIDNVTIYVMEPECYDVVISSYYKLNKKLFIPDKEKTVSFYTDDLMYETIKQNKSFTTIAENYSLFKQLIYDTILLGYFDVIDIDNNDLKIPVKNSIMYVMYSIFSKYTISIIYLDEIEYIVDLFTEILFNIDNCSISWDRIYNTLSYKHNKKIKYKTLTSIRQEQYNNILHIILKELNILVNKEQLEKVISNHPMVTYFCGKRVVSGYNKSLLLLLSRCSTKTNIVDNYLFLIEHLLTRSLYSKIIKQIKKISVI